MTRVQLLNRGAQLPHCQRSKTLSLRQGRPAFGIDEPDAHGPVGSVPEHGGAGGAWFGHK